MCTGDDDGVYGATGGFVQGDTFVTLDVEAGETVVCTFTNTKDASVKIIKDAAPNDAQTSTSTAPAPASPPTSTSS